MTITDTRTALDHLRGLADEVEDLRALKEWAERNLGIDYTTGDRVTIVSPEPSRRSDGWKRYREALAPGQTGIAGEITFNRYAGEWYVLVMMDRCWSVHERGMGEPADVRYWYGPADERPQGYHPAHEMNRTKNFAMRIGWVRKATTDTTEGNH